MRKSQYFFYKHKVTTSLLLSTTKRTPYISPIMSVRELSFKELIGNFYSSTHPIRFKYRFLGSSSLFFLVTGSSQHLVPGYLNYNLFMWSHYVLNLPNHLILKYSSQLLSKNSISFSKKHAPIFYNLVLGVHFSERSFRILFHLPVNGQKTWSSSKTTTRYNNFIFNQKFIFFKKFFPKSTTAMFYSEYFNLMYQAFFLKTWKLSKKNTRKGFFGKKFINMSNSLSLNALNLPTLKKSSKSKNLGFRFGFTRKLRAHLL